MNLNDEYIIKVCSHDFFSCRFWRRFWRMFHAKICVRSNGNQHPMQVFTAPFTCNGNFHSGFVHATVVCHLFLAETTKTNPLNYNEGNPCANLLHTCRKSAAYLQEKLRLRILSGNTH